MIAGETIVSLDPHLVDPSFVRDRVDEEEADFAVFRQGISERGNCNPSSSARTRTDPAAL